MRLIVARAARDDLKNIAHYSAREWGAVRKSRYMTSLRERFGALMRNPELGMARPDLGRGCRSLLAGSHVIFYRLGEAEVFLIRVLHQRMDARRHL